MLALLTSCGRIDLLKMTLESLYKDQQSKLFVTIHEDGLSRTGQHASIQNFLKYNNDKYYLHCEEDWEFNNSYDWISESVKIMESDPTIIKVLCRDGSPHPCCHDIKKGYGLLDPWENDGIKWHGFSWNPGVTRMDLLKQFIPFANYEQDVAREIYNAGYKVAELIKPIYKHIGNGRSTHE
jgi:hypothetical protein